MGPNIAPDLEQCLKSFIILNNLWGTPASIQDSKQPPASCSRERGSLNVS